MTSMPSSLAATKTGAAGKRGGRKSAPAKTHVPLTHPDRVYWQDAGVSKQDLVDYYAAVWPWMRPYVVGRPLALLRCPRGAAGPCFFQKHVSAGIDRRFLHLIREPNGDETIAIDNLDGLIALVQGGVLEIHLRGSSIERLEQADRLVFDLDPGPGVAWTAVIAAAREVRARLANRSLKSFVKTTGGKGLHVVVPIRPAPWDKVKNFARSIANAMAATASARYVATAAKAKREGRIFVDYLRNSREATAIAPYSTRARPGAPVATPIHWDELEQLASAAYYRVRNLGPRLKRLRRDPWAAMTRLRQSLPTSRAGGKKVG